MNKIRDFESFLGTLNRSKHTIRAYLSDLNKLGNNPEYLNSQQLTEKLSNLHIAPNSKARVVSSLKTYKLFLDRNFKIKTEPIYIPIKTEYNLPEIKPYLELKALLTKVKSIEAKIIISLFLETGVRVSSISKLNIEDIVGNMVRFNFIKNNKQSIKYITLNTLNLIATYLGPRKYKKDPLLINLRTKQRMSEDEIRKLLKKELKNNYINPHQFRHSFATYLLEKNFNIVEVKELLNHSNINTTQRYIHLNQSELNNKLAGVLQ